MIMISVEHIIDETIKRANKKGIKIKRMQVEGLLDKLDTALKLGYGLAYEQEAQPIIDIFLEITKEYYND